MSDVNPLNALIVRRIDVHDTLARFFIRRADHRAIPFTPGQFLTLGLIAPDPRANPNSPAAARRRGPRLIRRAYSIASPPPPPEVSPEVHTAPEVSPEVFTQAGAQSGEAMEFYIAHVPGGTFTDPLWKLREGDAIFMSDRADGRFTLDGIPPGKNLVMVSTGTGLAPFRAMYLHEKDHPRWRRLAMLDSGRSIRDLAYLDELRALARCDERLIYLPTVTRESWPHADQGLTGRVTQHLQADRFRAIAGFDLDPATCHVLLCGNPAMVDECETMLLDRGFVTRDHADPDGNLHFERYW